MYTQHTPALVGLLERLARAKLPDMDYPRVDRDHSPQAPRVGGWAGCGWVVGLLGGCMCSGFWSAVSRTVQL